MVLEDSGKPVFEQVPGILKASQKKLEGDREKSNKEPKSQKCKFEFHNTYSRKTKVSYINIIINTVR